jgi:diaminohydroxyphosphoribosylaminopyrimidine deaminase/5-amino-6-(5-phosphoribosylamino)uracil reductase
VGVNTVIADDPLLTARPDKGNQAVRIVADSFLRAPLDCQLFATAKTSPVIVFTSQHAVETNRQVAEEMTKKGVEILAYPDTRGRSNLYFLLDEVSRRGFTQLLVEGGATLLTSFLKENLADEIVIYIAPKILAAQGSIELTKPMADLSKFIGLHYVEVGRFGDDVRLSGLTEKALREISIYPQGAAPSLPAVAANAALAEPAPFVEDESVDE